ncbi:hypothetical protein SmJEL517_g04868 [Synchytrium microbalum]|uniref:M-phase inducer phosphatase n=1 Tax=Synchytrium microbalum TaxID=1806994 RepID=A0A507BYK7_9FUNG|nr:uncharacterized protein SmJEL517_g04868 [Synchytrium microbalum]TPX31949.1 hypothetical protein SmJEL517_g04868 [Synchytrium microbalum]
MDTDIDFAQIDALHSPQKWSPPSSKRGLVGISSAVRTPRTLKDEPTSDLIHAHYSPVTSLAAEMTSALEIIDGSPADKFPKTCLLVGLVQTSDPTPSRPTSTTLTSNNNTTLLKDSRPIKTIPNFPQRAFARNATASARLEGSQGSDMFATLPKQDSTTMQANPPSLPTVMKRPAFDLGTTSHWNNRRGTQQAGSRGINLATIPLRKSTLIMPPKPMTIIPPSNMTQKRAAESLERPVLRQSPNKNDNIDSRGGGATEDDDAMDVDSIAVLGRSNSEMGMLDSNNRHPPSKMRRMGSSSSWDEDELLYTMPIPDGIIPVGFTMTQGILPCEEKGKDTFPRISGATLVDVLDGKFSDQIDTVHVVDCRFDYEYEGGHIEGAINIRSPADMAKAFFNPPVTDKRVAIILHCEFSSQRAPSMAQRLRKLDRTLVPIAHYPSVCYPEVYVLKGGYKDFFAGFKERCNPQEYRQMNDEAFKPQLRQGLITHKREFRKTKSFS